jgi:hypothetical protein
VLETESSPLLMDASISTCFDGFSFLRIRRSTWILPFLTRSQSQSSVAILVLCPIGVSLFCQDAGLHPLRRAAKKVRMIDVHRSVCADQYILQPRKASYLTCARTPYIFVRFPVRSLDFRSTFVRSKIWSNIC